MLRKNIALFLSALMVLVGVSFAEDAARYLTGAGFTTPESAHAATSSGGVTLSTDVQTAITLTMGTSTLSIGSLTPGAPVFTTTSATVATNNATGHTLQANRNSVTSTMVHSDAVTTFPDYTAWNGSNSTTTNILGANLHFKVAFTGTNSGLYSSAFWGPNDTDGASNAAYAGFPSTSQTIASTSTFNSNNQVAVIRVRADAPATQKSGAYSGGTTFTAFGNP